MRSSFPLLPTVALAFTAALPAWAQDAPTLQLPPLKQPVYKCSGHSYSQVACTGGRELGTQRVSRTFDSRVAPPQDRARQMARAQLPPETQAQCATLETHIRQEEARQRAMATPPTEAEEGNLAIQRVHYREMRCGGAAP